jgi:hypothetical protein
MTTARSAKEKREKMDTTRKTAIIVGIFFLIQGIAAILINQVLAGPVIFAPDFLANAAAKETQLIVALLISLLNAAIAVGIAAMLLPVLKPYNKGVTHWFFGLSIIQFPVIALNEIIRLSILTLSQEYVKAGTPDAGYFQVIGNLLHAGYWWSHYLIMLVTCLVLPLFYYLLYQSKLVPRFISVWGFLGVALMLANILSAIFGRGVNMMLFIPIGLNQTFLAIWLIVKGFNLSRPATGQKFVP